MPKELIEKRTWGPPGTGKTREVQHLFEKVYDQYGGDAALVVSFTKAAAQEITSRIEDTNKELVGTLHAICYRALGRPTIAETKLKEFTAAHPEYALSRQGSAVDLDDPYDADSRTDAAGDRWLDELNLLRAKRVDPLLWPTSVQKFARVWRAWKGEMGYLDFTDLVEKCLTDVERAPHNPQIAIIDEAQDSPRLQLDLLRKWASHMQYLMLVSDVEQCLYKFAGATPEDLVNHPVPPEHRKVLSQSYRVPRAVFAVASSLRGQMTQREEGTYLPRPAEGAVRRLDYSYRQPEPIIEAALHDLETVDDEGKPATVMILAACSYMLDPIKAMLKQAGVPFGNSYRPKRGDWNPLRAGNGTSAAERLAMFLRREPSVWGEDRRMWTRDEVYQWSKTLKADGVFLPRIRIQMEAWKADQTPVTFFDLYNFFPEEVVDDLMFNADLDWYEARLLASKLDAMQYPLTVAKTYGGAALLQAPRITLGTVHSVKGGQSTHVYVFPDISRAGMQEWLTPGVEHDAILRVFYVAVTRARETLTICQRASPWAVEI